jgi:hypothetical protein
MKILFKQKQWMIVQVIFTILLLITMLSNKAQINEPIGGLAVALVFIGYPYDYAIPIFFILMSDLVFNVEYIQGTFLSHLLCGQERRKWILKRFLNFYLFILIQIVITFMIATFITGIVTGYFGLEGFRLINDGFFSNMKMIDLAKEIGLKIIKTFIFVSLGVFVSTIIPGRIAVGSVISMGLVYIMLKVLRMIYLFHNDSKIVHFFANNLLFENPTNLSWLIGILWVILFTLLTVERVKKVEIASRGA